MVPLFVSSGRSLGVAMIRRVIAVSLLLTLAAHARPPETADPALAPWFQQLHQPRTGAPCCSVADCRPTSFRQGPDGYEALIEDKWDVAPALWVRVPQDKILDETTNPTGTAVVCWIPGTGVLCFVRPAET
jgi:hypothetical protein